MLNTVKPKFGTLCNYTCRELPYPFPANITTGQYAIRIQHGNDNDYVTKRVTPALMISGMDGMFVADKNALALIENVISQLNEVRNFILDNMEKEND